MIETTPNPSLLPDWQRRSLAVLVADVVGYSRLMEANEHETHARMRSMRVGIIDPCIVSHRGQIVKNTGDGFLACFESPLDAVTCAAILQGSILQRESDQAVDRRISFRMGLTSEEVIVDDHDVFGGGVNIAARLQQCAAAGGVVISSGIKDQVGSGLPAAADDLGELHLKNLSKPIRAFACLMTLPACREKMGH